MDPPRNRPLILYVEDDDVVAYLVQKEIKEYDILRVGSGEQALDFLNRSGAYRDAPRPALVLLDLYMPKRSGFETLAEIRATPSLAGLPVAIFSTSQWLEDREKAFALGADHFIVKPSDLSGFSEVVATIAKILGPDPPGHSSEGLQEFE